MRQDADPGDGALEIPEQSAFDARAVRNHLARMLGSAPFQRSPRMRAFLNFLVEETLAGRGAQLKEYVIAVSVFGKPTDFDPSTSALVRVEAGRLRRLLAEYRLECGTGDKFQLVIPKGTYSPVFEPVRSTGESAQAPASGAAEAKDDGNWRSPAERRLVTVLSCAFSPGRSVLTDGDFLNHIDSFYGLCSSIAVQHGGAIDAGASDRIIIYFGWPDLMEDAPGRALTAALEIVSRASELIPAKGGVHVGIATSEVALGTAGGAHSLLPEVVGRAPALAMKLLLHAPLNGILVAESTRRLTGSSFEFVPGGISGEGDPELTPLWRLMRARAHVTRFMAMAGGQAGQLVGRQEELALLSSRWDLTCAGEGHAVLLTGEPGMGKSRLAETFAERAGAKAEVIRIQCSPHHCNSPLYPWVDFLRSEIGVEPDADRDDSRVGSYLERHSLEHDPNCDLIAGLLWSAQPVASLTVSQQKDRTLRLLSRIVLAHSRSAPLLLLVEDIHWADPTTLEFIHDILAEIPDSRILLVMTSRLHSLTTDFRETVITTIRLSRLSRQQSSSLIGELSGPAGLEPATMSLILSRAEGIPLFIEALTRSALAGEFDHSDSLAVPARLSDILSAQFSRLGRARGVAQIASAIGRQFSCTMLEIVAGEPEGSLARFVDQLVAAGILVLQPGTRSDDYVFRHALLRDAAYGSILPAARRQLHGQIGSVIVESFPDLRREHPDLVASHYSEAGLHEQAVPFWLEAARNAVRRYALTEAAASYRRALGSVRKLPESGDRRNAELDILIGLGSAVRSANGYGCAELRSIYESARALASALERPDALACAVYGLWTHSAGLGEWPVAVERAIEFEALTRTVSDNGQYAIESARLLGASAFFRGQFGVARGYFERALAIYDTSVHGPVLGFDPGAICAAYQSWTLWHLGESKLAREAALKAVAIAEAKEHASTLAMVLAWLVFYAVCEEDLDAIERYNARLQSVCDERDCRYWQPLGAACAEWAAFVRDRRQSRLKRMLELTGNFEEHYLTSCLLLLGVRMCLSLGRSAEGLDLVERAVAFMVEHDERVWEAEAVRLKAELLVQSDEAERAQAVDLARGAMKIARRQCAATLEARAAETLVRLSGGSVPGMAAGPVPHRPVLSAAKRVRRPGPQLPSHRVSSHRR